jgi:hypothetical protein
MRQLMAHTKAGALSMMLLLAVSTPASAGRPHRTRAALKLHERASTGNDGATIDSATGTVLVVAPPAVAPAGFVEAHSALVEHDLMLFKPTLVGISPGGPTRTPDLLAPSPVKKEIRFFVPAEGGDALEVRRDRDRLVLFRGPQSQGGAVAVGLAMFAATTIMSAHAPRALRFLFDQSVHFGPAIFDGGGMGAGIAGRGW